MVWFKTFSIHVAQFRDVGEVVVPLFKQFLCAIEKTDLLFRESRHPGPTFCRWLQRQFQNTAEKSDVQDDPSTEETLSRAINPQPKPG